MMMIIVFEKFHLYPYPIPVLLFEHLILYLRGCTGLHLVVTTNEQAVR